jgi:hypothetical protein
MAQTLCDLAPTIRIDRPVQSSFRRCAIWQVLAGVIEVGFRFRSPHHVPRWQRFNSDHVVAGHQPRGDLLHPISASIGDLLMDARDRRLGLLAASGAVIAADKLALQAGQAFTLLPPHHRSPQHLTV